MGTSLTGLTPATTYDALIKVGDNGPLSATAKILSDGLGNDSVLALSTGNVGVGTTTITTISGTNPVLTIGGTSISGGLVLQRSGTDKARLYESGDLFIHQGMSSVGHSFYVNASTEAMRITSASNVGIGTNTPAARLSVSNLGAAGIELQPEQTTDTNRLLNYNRGTGNYVNFKIDSATNQIFISGIEVARFTANGLTFNGDTAAANALDDYEEGTFTATLSPSVSGTITLNATYTSWTYTKIGRQVTINGVAVISSVSSPIGTFVILDGLPFNVLNNHGAYGGVTCTLSDASAGFAKSSIGSWHVINVNKLYIGIDASTLTASDELYITATYFV